MSSPPALFTMTLTSLCGLLAPYASIVVFLAPLPTIRSIQQARSTGSLPLLPYSSMIASTFLWTMYGILLHQPKIWVANAVGLVLGIYYVWAFVPHAPKGMTTTLPGSLAQHGQLVLAVLVVTIFLAFLGNATWIGRLGVIFCLALFASPLAALQTVLHTQSAASIPLPFTIATTVNCVLWTVWGIFEAHDSNIYVPNGLGLVFGLTQLALKVIYPASSSPKLTARYSPELQDDLLPK